MDRPEPAALTKSSGENLTGRLPSGRELRVTSTPRGEEIEVRSPGGEMELRVALTPEGPVLLLRGVRLEIDSSDAVALRCKDLDIRATGGIRLEAQTIALGSRGETHLKAMGQARIDAEVLHLNGGDRSEYPDGKPGYVPPTFELPSKTPPPASDGGGCCEHHSPRA